jgi:hypothetical protein
LIGLDTIKYEDPARNSIDNIIKHTRSEDGFFLADEPATSRNSTKKENW